MRQNAALAEQLLRVARLLELTGADRFRVLAHEKAARAVEGLSVDISSLACDERALRRIEGIGPKMAEKIAEFCTTGKIAELARLSTEVPAGIEELLRVPGLGPKTILKLWKEAGVNDLATLEKAIKDGTLLALKGMGEQKVSAMARGLEEMRRARGEAQGAGEAGAAPRTVRRLPLGLAWPVAERFVELLRGVEGVVRCEAAGSLRRGRETVGDIDILVAARDAASAAAASAAFRNGPGVREVLAAGPTKSSVRAAVLAELGRWGRELAGEEALKGPSVQVDLRVVEPDSWGAALQYFTGSKEHNVKVRERAVKRGLTLNEYGLFRLPGGNGARGGGRRPAKDPVREAEVEQGAGGTAQRGERVAGAHEQEIYAALGLGPIPPEVREDRGEIERYELAGDGPWWERPGARLVELADIRAELHAHTRESDGSMVIEELVARAKERGFHTVAVTDHSKSSAFAGGLTVERLERHVDNVRRVAESTTGVRVLAGSEVDILPDGSLDYDDRTLALLDIVVASPHAQLGMEGEKATTRLVRAVSHPRVAVLGHPTGRLIDRRVGLGADLGPVFAAARANRVALEINAHWLRLDLRDVHVRAAVEAGCLIAIDCDVHAAGEFANLRYGVATARRGWVTAAGCVNAWDADKLWEWLRSKKG